jgi:hypothetical protein
MGTLEVALTDGTSEFFQSQHQLESYYATLGPDGSLTVSRMEELGDGSEPTIDEVVARYTQGQFTGWAEKSA